jgi:pimeloyl-ACP methyl ester carboxylesterase
MREAIHVQTGSGRVGVRLSRGARTPVLLIHGNSMSGRAFGELLESPLGRSHRLIAADLPGHGLSDNAARPETAYTIPGYADAMLDVLFALDIPEAIVCGWSLGGHIALEMMARSPVVSGCFLTGTPPVSPGPAAINGFNMSNDLALFMTEALQEAEQQKLAQISLGAAASQFGYEDVARTDGRARPIMVENMLSGFGADPRPLFDNPERPIALVVGEKETALSQAFMQSINGPGLWRSAIQTIRGAGHAPFLETPAAFAALLLQFIRDVAKLRRARPAVATVARATRRTA